MAKKIKLTLFPFPLDVFGLFSWTGKAWKLRKTVVRYRYTDTRVDPNASNYLAPDDWVYSKKTGEKIPGRLVLSWQMEDGIRIYDLIPGMAAKSAGGISLATRRLLSLIDRMYGLSAFEGGVAAWDAMTEAVERELLKSVVEYLKEAGK